MESRAPKAKHAKSPAEQAGTQPYEGPLEAPADVLAAVGERKKVLDVACGSGAVAAELVRAQCDVVGIERNPAAAEEARRFCTDVLVANLDVSSLQEAVGKRRFDVVLFANDALARLREPLRVLDEARSSLGEGGYVVASIPNVAHGSIRAAMLAGRFDYQPAGALDESNLRFFTAKTIDELFVGAGYRVDAIGRVESPVEPVAGVDERTLDEVSSDPESRTLRFVVKATPLSNDQRLQAILKRFLRANTELADLRRQLDRRERELLDARGAVEERDAAVREVRRLEEHRARLELQLEGLLEAKKASEDLRSVNEALVRRVDSLLDRVLEQSRELQGQAAAPVVALASTVDDRYVAEYESALDAQRRLAQLERELNVARSDAERERGRVAALEMQLRDETSELEARIAELSAQASAAGALRAENAELGARNGELDARNGALDSENAVLRLDLEAERSRNAELARSLDAASAQTETLRATLDAERARANAVERAVREATERSGALDEQVADQRRTIAELEAASSRLQAEVAAVRSEGERERGRIERLAGDDRTHFDRATETLRAERERALEALRSEFSHQLDALRAEQERTVQSARAEGSRELDALRHEHERALAALASEHAAVLSARQDEFDRAIAAERSSRETAEARLIEASRRAVVLDERLDEERRAMGELQHEIEQVRDELARVQAGADAERARLEGLLETLRSEAAANETVLREAERRAAELEGQTAAYRETLSELQAEIDRLNRDRDAALRAERAASELARAHAERERSELQAKLQSSSELLEQSEGRLRELDALATDLQETIATARASEENARVLAEDLQAQVDVLAARTISLEESAENDRTALADLQAALTVANESQAAAAERAASLQGEHASKIASYEARLRRIADERNQLRADLASREKAAAQLSERIAALEVELAHERRERDAEVAEVRARLVEGTERERDLGHELQRLDREAQAAARRIGEYERAYAKLDQDCNELLAEAQTLVDAERAVAAQHRATIEALDAELEAIRTSALLDKQVMQDYANDARSRAAHWEAEFGTAIRQRDELYLRLLDTEKILAERDEGIAIVIAQRDEGIARLTAQRDGVHAELERARAEIAALQTRSERLQREASESQRQLVEQTEELILNVQMQAQEYSMLIDTVQSSHFWRFKRWLGKLFGG